jgi:prepilin-type processing-associated H-X9-DG protein
MDVESTLRFAGPGFPLNSTQTPDPRGFCFGSQHSGGVNFVMGDGHVVFVSETINQTMLGYLASRQDGQVVTIQ